MSLHLSKQNVYRLSAFLAPVLVVQLAPMIAKPAPRMASAGETDPMAGMHHPFVPPKPTPQQTAALEHAKLVLAAPIDDTPFHFAPPTAVITESGETESMPANPTDYRLTSITGSGRTVLAIVNGKVRRVGDQLAPGVVLESIDADSRTITIRDENGSPISLSLADPVGN